MNTRHAFMRHACYHRAGSGIALDPDSTEICLENIRSLVEKVGVQQFIVHSSPDSRTLLTREAVVEELKRLGCETEVPEPTAWLTPDNGAVNMDNISLLFEKDDAFYLIIMHKSQIHNLLEIEEDKIFHGAIFPSKTERIN